MNERRDLALLGAFACGVSAGLFLAVRATHRARPKRRTRSAARESPPRLALPPRVPPRSAALAAVLPDMPVRRLPTYETVRVASVPSWKIPITVAGSTATLVGAIVIGLALSSPQVTAVAGPGVAYPGSTAVVSYATSGFGTTSYRLDARTWHRSGTLSAHEGAIGVPIGQHDANTDVLVIVRTAGPFGSDARVARIRVLARPRAAIILVPSNAVHIDALSLAETTVSGGALIGLRYRTNATAGNVLLRDARGGLWQRAPLSKNGFTQLRVPVTLRDTPFTVVLQAGRNGSAIENSLALMVTGIRQTPSSAPRSDAARVVSPDIPVAMRSGALLVTSAVAGRTAAVIELTAPDGTELRRATPGPDGTTELRMPAVTTPQWYLVSVSYQQGTGRNASFHRIHVLPSN